MEKPDNYKSDRTIDINNLHTECVRNPQLYDDWARYEAYCKDIRDRAKANHEIKKSEVELEIRKTSETKLTDKTVQALSTIDERVIGAQNEFFDAKKEARDAVVARRTFGDQRKASLDNLVRLHGQGYFISKGQEHSVHNALREGIAKTIRNGKVS